jgi:hypothetical protein
VADLNAENAEAPVDDVARLTQPECDCAGRLIETNAHEDCCPTNQARWNDPVYVAQWGATADLEQIGRDGGWGLDLFASPQRPASAQGPERHISMAGAEIHGHPDSCCCHAPCGESACYVPSLPPAKSTGDADV